MYLDRVKTIQESVRQRGESSIIIAFLFKICYHISKKVLTFFEQYFKAELFSNGYLC